MSKQGNTVCTVSQLILVSIKLECVYDMRVIAIVTVSSALCLSFSVLLVASNITETRSCAKFAKINCMLKYVDLEYNIGTPAIFDYLTKHGFSAIGACTKKRNYKIGQVCNLFLELQRNLPLETCTVQVLTTGRVVFHAENLLLVTSF